MITLNSIKISMGYLSMNEENQISPKFQKLMKEYKEWEKDKSEYKSKRFSQTKLRRFYLEVKRLRDIRDRVTRRPTQKGAIHRHMPSGHGLQRRMRRRALQII